MPNSSLRPIGRRVLMPVNETSFRSSLSRGSETVPTQTQAHHTQNGTRTGTRRVLHVSCSDVNGGAARGAHRLHHGLRKRGDDSRLFVLNQEAEEETTHSYQPDARLLPSVIRILRKEYLRRAQLPYQQSRPRTCEHFRDDRTQYGKEVWEQMPPADIVNLHWIAGFVDYHKFFNRAAASTPLVWTMHDMNPFTGGCHYDLDCGRFTSACGSCPQLGSTKTNDLSRAVYRRKMAALARLAPERMRIVTGSHWLEGEARRSPLLSRFDIRTIHYGIDTHAFRPRDRFALRALLDIPPNAFVVTFAADHLNNDRKGLGLLVDALNLLPSKGEICLLSVGAGEPVLSIPFPHIHLGYLTSDDMLSIFYSAGDCFVIPSVQEVFGLTALEAMACATPVVGFATGGIPEMVKPHQSGLLAPATDVSELSKQIHWFITHPDEARAMGEGARRLAEKEFTVESQARRYGELYDELQEAVAGTRQNPNK